MDVILLANDIVPGGQLPVAAPGLRQWGIAEGLRARGLDVELVIPRPVADRMWGGVPAPVPPGALVLGNADIPALVRSRTPSVVVLTNSNQHELVAGIPGTRYVYDFFAPKVLELVCERGDDVDWKHLAKLRERKIRALGQADAVLLNGEKKRPYVLAWMLQTDRDVTRVPLLPLPMCVPVRGSEPPPARTPMRVGIAGYLQAWSQPGPWLDIVGRLAADGRIELHVLLPPHWGGSGKVDVAPSLRRLAEQDGVVHHSPKTYESFVDFLASLDFVLDLFDWSLEREYAMVTRTVVALAAGRPVVHPPFTEVSPAIEEAGAGWLVDVHSDDLETILEKILGDPTEVRRRAANAQRLAAQRFDPEVAVAALADQITVWAS